MLQKTKHTHSALLVHITAHLDRRLAMGKTVLLQHIYSHITQKKANSKAKGEPFVRVLKAKLVAL
jgi:hypothetical protein